MLGSSHKTFHKTWVKIRPKDKAKFALDLKQVFNNFEKTSTKEQAVELDKWQRLTFDFSDQSSATQFTRMLVQFNGENNFDNLLHSC